MENRKLPVTDVSIKQNCRPQPAIVRHQSKQTNLELQDKEIDKKIELLLSNIVYAFVFELLLFFCGDLLFLAPNFFFAWQMILKMETITQQRESQMNELWQEMQHVLRTYLSQTEEKMGEYMLLRDRDDENTEIIRHHYIEIEKAANTIGDLKERMDAIRTAHRIHLEQLLKYKQLLVEKQTSMKANMDEGLTLDKQRMRQLVVCCTDAQKVGIFCVFWLWNELIVMVSVFQSLQMWLEKGRGLLQIAAICRKLETEREKIIPCGRQDVHNADLKKPPDEFKDVSLGLFAYMNESCSICPANVLQETLNALSQMDNFWIRYNNVRIDCASLEEERSVLKHENQLLKAKLKQYLSSVCLNGGGFQSDAERLRPSSMKVEKIVHIDLATNSQTIYKKDKMQSGNLRRRPVTSIEANLSVAVRSEKLLQAKTRTPCIFPSA